MDSVPEAPQFLDINGSIEFDRVAQLLYGARVLTQADFGLLTAYAASWSCLVKQWENGLHPKSAEVTAFRQLASELGLSPRSRASLPPPSAKPKKNIFSDFGIHPRDRQ